MEQSQWYLTSSIFECMLVHDIPNYGQGVFYHEAGEGLRFYTTTHKNPMKVGRAALVVEASMWRPGNQIWDLGYVDVEDSKQPLNVATKEAEQMMQGLTDGLTPTFTRVAWYSDESIRLKISNFNFMSVYSGYLDCLAGLLPVNFRQVEKTRVHFEIDKATLTDDDKKALDNVILYVTHDPSVTSIYVDGHTDSSGRRIYNRRLSKVRAETVRDYLINKGLSEDSIRTRYHGERYPVAKNNSKENKKMNRRTTVRLVRDED
jgi:outer membrane protein OmpA-like peptidoglycan-associated protein